MATLLPEGKQSFTDGAGKPLVGGKLYTYDAGTSTPRPTYADAAGTIANTNPVVLDARGEATVFWQGAYKAVLKDASGVTVWTVDHVLDGGAALALDLMDTAPGKGAALVGIADAGNYYAGANVESALQEVGAEMSTPRTIAKGGTGASTPGGALVNLGIANINSEVAITGSLTIPNAFPASYVVRDSGTPADYNIFLPAAAAVGSVVFFRIDQAATKMFTLYDGGTLMDGIDRRSLWAGESVMLYKTASGWTKIGGQSIPMHGALRRSASQSLTTAGWQSVVFTEGLQDNKGLNLCFDSVNGRFIAKRAGVYKFAASFAVSGITVGSETYGAFAIDLDTEGSGSPNAISISTKETGQSRNTHNISNIYKLARDQKYSCAVYTTTGTPSLEYLAGKLEISMTYEEVVTW